MKDVFYFELDGKKHEYHVKDDVPFSDLLVAIENGFNMCFMEDGSYHPELFDFAKDYIILATLTDIDLGDSADDVYRIIRAIDGVRSVDADFILDGMVEKAKFYEKMLAASAGDVSSRRIADAIEAVAIKINNTLNSIDIVLDNVGQKVESGELTDVQKLLHDLANVKGVTPEHLVSGMLEYNNSKKKPAGKTAKRVATKE